MLTLLKNAVPTLIFSFVKASLITGNIVPHSTAKQLASSTTLLNRKLDSRETTESNSFSLFKKSRRLKIKKIVPAVRAVRYHTK